MAWEKVEMTFLLQIPNDITNIGNAIVDWLTPFGLPQGVVIGGFIAIGIIIWLRINYFRQPAHDFLGIYEFTMPHRPDKFKARVWALHQGKRVDEMIEGFAMFHKDNMDSFNRISTLLDQNRHIANAYLLHYEDTEIATKRSGWALMLTNAPLEDGHYYHTIDAIKHMLSMPTKINLVAQSGFTGFLDVGAGKWVDSKGHLYSPCDQIYYPMQPIIPSVQPPEEIRTSAKVMLSMAAEVEQTITTMRESHRNEIIAKAADERASAAESLSRRLQAQVNHERRQRIKKDYWSGQLTTIGTPLSLALILIVIGGCAVMLPDIFSKNLPGYTSQHYIAAAVMIGGIIVWAIGHFSNRNSGE